MIIIFSLETEPLDKGTYQVKVGNVAIVHEHESSILPGMAYFECNLEKEEKRERMSKSPSFFPFSSHGKENLSLSPYLPAPTPLRFSIFFLHTPFVLL